MKYQITYTLTCVATFETDAEEDTNEFYAARNAVTEPGIRALNATGVEIEDTDIEAIEAIEE